MRRGQRRRAADVRDGPAVLVEAYVLDRDVDLYGRR